MSLPREVIVLTERYLDGDLDVPGRQRLVELLRSDEALLAGFTAQLDLSRRLADAHVGEDFAARTVRRVTAALVEPARSRPPSNTERLRRLTQRSSALRAARRPSPRVWAWALPLAACLVIAVITGVALAPRTAAVAVIVAVGNDAGVVVRGQRQLPATTGFTLQHDDVLRTAAGSATLRYGDGTRVRVEASSTLALTIGTGKRLRLEQGELHAQVTPQRADLPLRIMTTQGEAEVLGTVFRLSSSPARTRLQVEEGRVRLHGSGPSVTALVVTAGRAAIATTTSVEWEAQSLQAAPLQAAPLPAQREVLLVRRDPASDRKVAARLTAAGFRIVERTDATVTAADARGKALVLISEQVSAQALGTRLRDVPVPLMVSESGLYPALGLASAVGGAIPSRTVTIVQPQHPLAAGLGGAVVFTDSTLPLSAVTTTAVPAGAVIATVPAIAGRRGALAAIIAYDRDQALADGTRAPARRVGFFLSGALEDHLTPAGWALFDAAVAWCAGPEPPVSPPPSPTR